MPLTQKSLQLISIIKRIPSGKITTYGKIAKLAGQPHSARQVSRLLYTSSKKYSLPWHRVINVKGRISLPWESGGAKQAKQLKAEGVFPNNSGTYNFDKYGWNGCELSLHHRKNFGFPEGGHDSV